eukprot:jgi/Tetstr1/460380/TSEL_000058.t1
MATHAKLIPGTPYGKAVMPERMTIPLGALCSTGRIVKDVVLSVHLVMYMKHVNALDLAEAWQQSELGRNYQAGKRPPANVMFKGEEEVFEVTPHWEAAVPTFGGKPIVSTVQRKKVVSLPLAGTAASPKLHGLAGVLAQQQKRAGGIIKHNTNAVKNLAATQAVPGDNIHQVQRDLYEEGRHDGLPQEDKRNKRGYLARAYPNESAGAQPIRGKIEAMRRYLEEGSRSRQGLVRGHPRPALQERHHPAAQRPMYRGGGRLRGYSCGRVSTASY